MIYVIGSLRNPRVPQVAADLRFDGHEVFDDWFAAGPEADDHWQRYEQARGHTLEMALDGHAAQHVFKYDKSHLDRCEAAVLVLPAGKSGHLELGYVRGQRKPIYILLDKEPERYDVMYAFADLATTDFDKLRLHLKSKLSRQTAFPYEGY
jgi:nucleoside 2-deoxyribosyltransferase